jgi:hypothetical protein
MKMITMLKVSLDMAAFEFNKDSSPFS